MVWWFFLERHQVYHLFYVILNVDFDSLFKIGFIVQMFQNFIKMLFEKQ